MTDKFPKVKAKIPVHQKTLLKSIKHEAQGICREERRYLHQIQIYMLIFRVYKTEINKKMTDNSVFKKLKCYEQVFDEEAIGITSKHMNKRQDSSKVVFYSFKLEVEAWIFDLLIHIFHLSCI